MLRANVNHVKSCAYWGKSIMENPELTQDAQRLAVLIYKQYKNKIDNGRSKQDAKNVGGLEELHSSLKIKYSEDDTLDLVRELSRNEYLDVMWANNTAVFIEIESKLIIFGENKLANDIDDVLTWANKIVSIFKP